MDDLCTSATAAELAAWYALSRMCLARDWLWMQNCANLHGGVQKALSHGARFVYLPLLSQHRNFPLQGSRISGRSFSRGIFAFFAIPDAMGIRAGLANGT